MPRQFKELRLSGAEARALRSHPNVVVLDDNAFCRHCVRDCARTATALALIFGALLVGVYTLALIGLYDSWLGSAFTFRGALQEGQGGHVPQGAYLGSTAEAVRKQYQIDSA